MQPEAWSVNRLATELGVDRRTIASRLSKAGVEPVERQGRTKLYAMRDAAPAILAPVLAPASAADADAPKRNPRDEVDRQRAEKLRLENEAKRGALVDREEMDAVFLRAAAVVRSHMRAVPSKAKRMIACLTREDVRTLRDLIDDALEGLSKVAVEGEAPPEDQRPG